MDIRDRGTSSDFYSKGKVKFIDILMDSLRLPRDAKLLDVGCGTGEDLEVLNRHGQVYAVDTSKKTLDELPKGLYYKKKLSRMDDLKFPTSSFDVVAAFDVIEHIKNDKKAAKEVMRVLKPGGHFVFTVPAFQFLFSAHDEALGHYRRYNMPMIKRVLAGFNVERLGYWNFFIMLPVALGRGLRKDSKGGSDLAVVELPRTVNTLLFWIVSLENLLTKLRIQMPAGLSIYGVCRKP